MSDEQEYRFRIDAFSVDTIPMARLAEYMAGFARLLGEHERVHFKGLEPGSAILVSEIEEPALPKVAERLQRFREGRAPRDLMEAYKALDNLLAKDNAIGALTTPGGGEIIMFPGRTRAKPVQYGPFREHGSLDGVVVRLGSRSIGGIDKTIPVLLCDGEATYSCQASVELSKRLARHYLGSRLRVRGSGKWIREEDRTWTLQQFDIDDFDVLDDAPLSDLVQRLHAIEGGLWDDPALTDLLGMRRAPEDRH